MKITIILCTYNRCGSLAKALQSASALRLPDSDEWEVLVVDNNSSDKTREVVEEFRGRYPGRFRYLFEPQQGKSYALNAGVREARGDVLAFTDDDVTFEPMWLQNLTASLRTGEWAGAGGRTLPPRGFSPPRWLSTDWTHALGPLAIFDRGPDAHELTETPFGNNMAYRKEMFERYGGFRTDLGPASGSKVPQKNEDVEFGRRLLAAGERLRYEPSAVVYHEIPERRLTRKYFLHWWFDKARADVRESGGPANAGWRLAGIPVASFRRLIIWTLRWIFSPGAARRFSCKVNVWSITGSIVESFRQSRDAGRNSPKPTLKRDTRGPKAA